MLLGAFQSLEDKEVMSKQKDLLVNTLRGVLRARLESNTNRAVPPSPSTSELAMSGVEARCYCYISIYKL